jgi:hypothetical protein
MMNNKKEVKNPMCGFQNCDNPCGVKISFQLGFSAWFCSDCANKLIRDGLGIVVVPEK